MNEGTDMKFDTKIRHKWALKCVKYFLCVKIFKHDESAKLVGLTVFRFREVKVMGRNIASSYTISNLQFIISDLGLFIGWNLWP
jgi:hypothetical protein